MIILDEEDQCLQKAMAWMSAFQSVVSRLVSAMNSYYLSPMGEVCKWRVSV